MSACYWPLNLHVLAWVALVPWLVVLPRISPLGAWVYGALLGLVFYRLGFAWLCTLAGPLGVAIVVGLALWMGLSFRIARLLMERFSTAAMLWAVPLAFVGQEILRSEGLPHYRLAYLGWGYSQSHDLWVAQIASIGGVYLVTFLLVAFNAAVAYALVRRTRRGWAPLGGITAGIVVLGIVAQPSDDPSSRQVGVACVQAENVADADYVRLTRQAIDQPNKPAFVVLPEHTIEDIGDERHPLIRALVEVSRENQVYICVGAHVRAKPGTECPFDNVGLLIDPQGQIVGSQPKAVPVPFFVNDGNPAQFQETIQTAWGRTGTYICFDASFSDIPRQLVDRGAGLLLAPLMNPARWPVQQCWQQADMAPFRSIELRRCAVRAASSGISQIVWPDGSVRAKRTREEGDGILSGTAVFTTQRTPFVRGGYLFGTAIGYVYLAGIAWLTLAGWGAKLRQYATRPSRPIGCDASSGGR